MLYLSIYNQFHANIWIYPLLNMFLLYLSVKNLHLPNNIAAGRQDRPLTSVVIILLKNLNCVNSCAILFIFKTLFKFRKGQTATSTLSLIIYFASFLSCYYLRLLDLELLIPTSQSRSILHSFFFFFLLQICREH